MARTMTAFLHLLQFNAILPSGEKVVWRVWMVEKDKRYLVHQKLAYREIFELMFAYSFQVVFDSQFPADFCKLSL